MTYHAYSTLSNDTEYALYADTNVKDLPIVIKSVKINGGANVADKYNQTPKSVMTELTDEDYEFLKNDYHFKQHVAAGHIRVERHEMSPTKAAVGMKEKDLSAQKTPKDQDIVENAKRNEKRRSGFDE